MLDGVEHGVGGGRHRRDLPARTRGSSSHFDSDRETWVKIPRRGADSFACLASIAATTSSRLRRSRYRAPSTAAGTSNDKEQDDGRARNDQRAGTTAAEEDPYGNEHAISADGRRRARDGKIVIKPSDHEGSSRGRASCDTSINPWVYRDTAILELAGLRPRNPQPLGEHRRQGGVVVYVSRAVGYSIVDGERARTGRSGDLVLLPFEAGRSCTSIRRRRGSAGDMIAFLLDPESWSTSPRSSSRIKNSPEFKE